MKEDYQKALKKLNIYTLSNLFRLNGQYYQKQKGLRSSDQSLFSLQNKLRKFPLLVMYYLSKFDDIIKVVFELFQKLYLLIYASQFMTL